eukprot:scaffold1011_cov17-Tisochrysis_lutea.AAC.1
MTSSWTAHEKAQFNLYGQAPPTGLRWQFTIFCVLERVLELPQPLHQMAANHVQKLAKRSQ